MSTGDGVQLGVFHLAGHEALPDELIELELVVGELALTASGRMEGSEGRMASCASCAPALIYTRSGSWGSIRGRISPLINAPAAACASSGDAQRVGTHIGDQAVRGAFAEVDALIELLRDHHRALRREAEPAVGLLLQGGGGERRHRLAALDGVLDAADRERRVFQLSDNPAACSPSAMGSFFSGVP